MSMYECLEDALLQSVREQERKEDEEFKLLPVAVTSNDLCSACGKDLDNKREQHADGCPNRPRKLTDPYTGPWPRSRHSHRCQNCENTGRCFNSFACYKSRCGLPQRLEKCEWCGGRPR